MFGQFVIGFPNSGKSTFCHKVGEYLQSLGRNVKWVNLDPGCDELPYNCDIDIRDIICIEEIMVQEQLGPNESLVFAMDFLLVNMAWLLTELSKLPKDSYLMIDMPGQVELYIHHAMIPKIVAQLTDPKGLDYRLVAVFLVDSILCHSAESYVSTLFATLPSMLHLAMPQVNILSKSSLIRKRRLPVRLSDLKNVRHLEHIVEHVKDRRGGHYKEMLKQMLDVIVDLPWLSYSLFDEKNEKSMKTVVSLVDVANGFYNKQLIEETVQQSQPAKAEDDRDADEFVSNFL